MLIVRPKIASNAVISALSDVIFLDNGLLRNVGLYRSFFAHGCYVTSMSVEGNRMALDHSFTHLLIHSLTHSILINLFIKTGLNRFSYPSPA